MTLDLLPDVCIFCGESSCLDAQTKVCHGEEQMIVLREIDGMIESTEEFIRDDGLNADETRIHDLSALIKVREIFCSFNGIEG